MDRQRRRSLDRASPLDPNLAERVLSGALAPEDLPPALGPVAGVIQAIRPDLPSTGSVRMDATRAERDLHTIGSMVSVLSDSHSARRWPRRLRRRSWFGGPALAPRPPGGFRVRLATSVVAAMIAFLMGMAYAGRLPGGAQDVASVVLSKVGLSVPRHHGAGGGTESDGQDETGDQGDGEKNGVGPDPNGAAHDGLCNAFFHGSGGSEGKKFDSVAFQNLRDAAAASGQTVEQFCGVEEGAAGNIGGKDKGSRGRGQGTEESDDQGEDESDDQGEDQDESEDQADDDQGRGSEDGHGNDGSGGDQSGGQDDQSNGG